MAKTPLQNQHDVDLRDTTWTSGDQPVHVFYDQKVRVLGSTKTGYAEMFGVLTGVTYTKNDEGKVTQIIVYMEGQQSSVFDATRSGVWINLVGTPPKRS